LESAAKNIVVYELHRLHEGKWQISSLFEDRESALAEAEKLELTEQFAGVRVVEEQYDIGTKKSESRTIFKSAREDIANADRDMERQEAEGRTRRHDARLIERITRDRDREWRLWLLQIFLLSSAIAGGAVGLLWLVTKILA
jgi:hypothetical protein